MTSPSLGPSGLRRTVAPTLQPVSLSIFKMHAEVYHDDQDILLSEYLDNAADYVEAYQNRCWRQSTWQAVYDSFPCDGVFYLPRPPLASVTSITYLDLAGDSQTLSTSSYVVDIASEPGRVSLAYGELWPDTIEQNGCVTVTYVAGYSSASDVPSRVKQAIRIIAAHYYSQREPVVVGERISNAILSATDLMDQDRLLSYR